jgi:peroxiredoxin
MIIGLIACNSTPPNSFKLEGFVEGAKNAENMRLYYFSLHNGEWHEIADTTKIINGKFLFEGNIDELTAAELCFDDSYVAISARIYLEPTMMKLRIDRNKPYTYELSGTKVEKENIELRKELELDAKTYYEGLKRMDDTFKQIHLNVEDNNIFILDSLINLLQYTKEHTLTIYRKMNKTYLDFILKHNTYQIIPDLIYLLSNQELISIDSLEHIYNSLPERSKTGLMGQLACKRLKYQKNETVLPEDTLMGNPAPDFTRKDPVGKTIRLSDFKNKHFVLLDFWASWCAPCIKEIPKMKKLYDKYSEKGLVIISISCDTDSNKWLNSINKYKLDQWPQILNIQNENGSYFNAEDLCNLYNVKDGIPHFVLIDKQGKIIARWGYLGEEQLIDINNMLNNNSFIK